VEGILVFFVTFIRIKHQILTKKGRLHQIKNLSKIENFLTLKKESSVKFVKFPLFYFLILSTVNQNLNSTTDRGFMSILLNQVIT
jgi:hypothetical protein